MGANERLALQFEQRKRECGLTKIVEKEKRGTEAFGLLAWGQRPT